MASNYEHLTPGRIKSEPGGCGYGDIDNTHVTGKLEPMECGSVAVGKPCRCGETQDVSWI